MTPNAQKAIRNVALTIMVGGATVGAGFAWKRYGKLDPYKGVARPRRQDPATSITADGVKIKHYQNGTLVTSADADHLTIDQGRTAVGLQGIRNGVIQTKQGPMQFAAKNGMVRPTSRLIDVAGGVRVKGADFDIQSMSASIDAHRGELRVPTTLTGTIKGGDFDASSLIHRPNTSYTLIKDVHWKGKLPLGQDAPTGEQNRVWDVVGKTVLQDGVNWTYTDGRAADGEVIVMAPNVKHNTRTDVLVATSENGRQATYRSAKADMIADKITVYRKEGRAVCEGHVVMLVRSKKDWDKPLPKDEPEGSQPLSVPLPPELGSDGKTTDRGPSPAEKQRDDDLRSGKTLRDYPMNLKADMVTYWYKKGQRHAIAKGKDAIAYQKFEDGRWWRRVTAPEAHYDGEKEVLDLVGDTSKRQVRMVNSIGDDVFAFGGTMSTKEDQTEDDEKKTFDGPRGKIVDRGDPDDPRTDDKTKPGDGKTTPPPVQQGAPPTKTPPPTKG